MVTKLVGARIAQLRRGLGLSQVEFTRQIGMARTYFAEVETGKRNVSMRNLEKITSGLGVTLAEFFDCGTFDPLYRPPVTDDRHPPTDASYELVRPLSTELKTTRRG